jgi:cytochrome c oxidase assembly protein subunit 15
MAERHDDWSPARRGLHRWAAVLVAATFLLIAAGGLVTSRGAGLAVPDWPLSFGTINPPRWYAIENVRTEHGHRLIAGCVALLTAVVAWRARRLESRRSVRLLAYAGVAAVLVQAVLGGLRVLALSVDLAMIHGWLAQMFLCIAVALAVVTSRHWQPSREEARSAGLDIAASAATVLVVAQLVVGIFIRHSGAEIRPLAASAIFYVHIAGGAAILGTALLVRTLAGRGRAASYLARRTRLLVGLTAVQIALGIGTWAATENTGAHRSATPIEAWLPTLHVVMGAAVLATALSIALHALAQRRTVEATLVVRAAEVSG